MPLTNKGKKALKNFKKEYGEDKGENIFYSYMSLHPDKTKSWHRRK